MPTYRYGPDNPPPELLQAVRERLAGVCADWPTELFETVTLRAAWIEFKYDRAMTDGFAVVRLRELREEQQERSMSA